jgi:hypothetical protein
LVLLAITRSHDPNRSYLVLLAITRSHDPNRSYLVLLAITRSHDPNRSYLVLLVITLSHDPNRSYLVLLVITLSHDPNRSYLVLLVITLSHDPNWSYLVLLVITLSHDPNWSYLVLLVITLSHDPNWSYLVLLVITLSHDPNWSYLVLLVITLSHDPNWSYLVLLVITLSHDPNWSYLVLLISHSRSSSYFVINPGFRARNFKQKKASLSGGSASYLMLRGLLLDLGENLFRLRRARHLRDDAFMRHLPSAGPLGVRDQTDRPFRDEGFHRCRPIVGQGGSLAQGGLESRLVDLVGQDAGDLPRAKSAGEGLDVILSDRHGAGDSEGAVDSVSAGGQSGADCLDCLAHRDCVNLVHGILNVSDARSPRAGLSGFSRQKKSRTGRQIVQAIFQFIFKQLNT